MASGLSRIVLQPENVTQVKDAHPPGHERFRESFLRAFEELLASYPHLQELRRLQQMAAKPQLITINQLRHNELREPLDLLSPRKQSQSPSYEVISASIWWACFGFLNRVYADPRFD